MLRRLFRLYVYSNFHIAISALLFVNCAFLVIGQDANPAYLLFVFAGTLAVYSLHRIIGHSRIAEPYQFVRHKIFTNSLSMSAYLLGLVCFIGLFAFWRLSHQYKIGLIVPIFISILYVIPFLRRRRLRDFNYIKIFCICIVWAWLFTLPIVISDAKHPDLIWLEKAFFILALTIPFDLRDSDADRSQNLRTIANTLGIGKSIILALILMLLSLLLATYLNILGIYGADYFKAIVLSYVISFGFVACSKGRGEFYHLFYLDGMIGLQGVLTLFFNY